MQRLKKVRRDKGDPNPLSHKARNGPAGFLSSFSERSLGAAGSRLHPRLQQFMFKAYVWQQFKVGSQLERENHRTSEFKGSKRHPTQRETLGAARSGPEELRIRITESQNSRGWKGPLWVI